MKSKYIYIAYLHKNFLREGRGSKEFNAYLHRNQVLKYMLLATLHVNAHYMWYASLCSVIS